MGIPAVYFPLQASEAKQSSSDYDTQGFIDKVNMKTLAMIYCLQYGFNTLISDVDIVFFKNPFAAFQEEGYDLFIQREEDSDDSTNRNSGFMYLCPFFPLSLVMPTQRSAPTRCLFALGGCTSSRISVNSQQWTRQLKRVFTMDWKSSCWISSCSLPVGSILRCSIISIHLVIQVCDSFWLRKRI